VARASGYSIGTVSRALAGKAVEARISEKAVRAIQRAAARLGYSPNVVARSLRTRTTRMVGLVVSDIANPFFGRIASFAERAAPPGYSLVVTNSGEDAARERACLEALAARRVDGILLSPAGPDPAAALAVARQGIAVVTFDREYAATATRRFDAVVCNNRETAARLAARLARNGASPARLGFVGGSLDSSTHRERLAGFRDVAPGGRAVFGAAPEEAAGRLRGCDGILFANSLLAEGVIAWLLRNDPDRLRAARLASFDDSPLFAAVPVVFARQPEERMAAKALELLLRRVGNGANGRGGTGAAGGGGGASRRRVVLKQAIESPRR
jgi:LacI family transcriptional regulator